MNRTITERLIDARRQSVNDSYASAKSMNLEQYLNGNDMCTEEYVFDNQKIDAHNIVDTFRTNPHCRVISITKKTKVGMDGLMIEIVMLMATHPDDSFVTNYNNVRIITGMSNVNWEKDMINKAPGCFKDKIFHHGKLKHADLMRLKDALIIIDEIDTGDKEGQQLHRTLEVAGILNANYLHENNVRLVFTSATMIKQLYDLYRWGDAHHLYKMSIPSSYIGHIDFLNAGIVKEFYPMNTMECAEKWIDEDILQNYKDDWRVHFVRVTKMSEQVVQNACKLKNTTFRNHTAKDKLTPDDIHELFKKPLTEHIVVLVKGLLRRANLIPNAWKMRIGAMHELHTKVVDNNVQVQGLVGRMTGYWKHTITNGHKTGPYRTSIEAIREYERTFNDPFGPNSYQTSGFKKKNGSLVKKHPTMLSTKNVDNLEGGEFPNIHAPKSIPIVVNLRSNEYTRITRNRKIWDIDSIYNVLKLYDPNLVDELMRIDNLGGKDQVVQPTSDNKATYDKYITEFVEAAHKKQAHTTVGNKRGVIREDTFQIFLDKKDKRVIVSLYYGSKLEKNTATQ